jgi:hypothetical protein
VQDMYSLPTSRRKTMGGQEERERLSELRTLKQALDGERIGSEADVDYVYNPTDLLSALKREATHIEIRSHLDLTRVLPLEQVGAENGAFLGTLPESLNSMRVCHWGSFLSCLLGVALASHDTRMQVCHRMLQQFPTSRCSCRAAANLMHQLPISLASQELHASGSLHRASVLSPLTCSCSGSLQTRLDYGLMASMYATKQASARKQALRVSCTLKLHQRYG